jgi:transposase-like protein
LQTHWRILYLDGIHFSVRHGDQADTTVILTALGVDLAGNKEVLSLRACAEEGKDGWVSVLQDLRARGATQMDLIVTDGHEGLLGAVTDLFPAAPRQRCLLHKQRNVLNAVPRRVRQDIANELQGIWDQPDKQGALTHLAAFKAKYAKMYPEAVRSLAEEESDRVADSPGLPGHAYPHAVAPRSLHREKGPPRAGILRPYHMLRSMCHWPQYWMVINIPPEENVQRRSSPLVPR